MQKSPSASHSNTEAAPGATSTPSSNLSKGLPDPSKQMFLSATLGMSWQLAVAVLVPVYGGYRLDGHFHSQPLWTILGFVVAIGLAVIIVARAVKTLNRQFEATNQVKPKKEN